MAKEAKSFIGKKKEHDKKERINQKEIDDIMKKVDTLQVINFYLVYYFPYT